MNPIVKYGILLAFALMAFKTLEFSYFTYRLELETYLLLVSVLFLAIGIIAGIKMSIENKTADPSEKYDKDREFNEISVLTGREKEVLHLIKQGMTNKEISSKLFISLNTTKTHLKNIYSKLDARNRTEALEKAKKYEIMA